MQFNSEFLPFLLTIYMYRAIPPDANIVFANFTELRLWDFTEPVNTNSNTEIVPRTINNFNLEIFIVFEGLFQHYGIPVLFTFDRDTYNSVFNDDFLIKITFFDVDWDIHYFL